MKSEKITVQKSAGKAESDRVSPKNPETGGRSHSRQKECEKNERENGKAREARRTYFSRDSYRCNFCVEKANLYSFYTIIYLY